MAPSGSRKERGGQQQQPVQNNNSNVDNNNVDAAAAVAANLDVASPSSRGSISSTSGLDQPANENWGWQGSRSCVLERVSYLFRNTILSDVTFVVGKEEDDVIRVPAHKMVLSMGSTVFDAMFNGRLATDDREITVPDIEPSAFLVFLRFLYTDEHDEITHFNVMTTLYAAKKYAVPALQTVCVEFLKKNLRPDNAFLLVTQARLFDEYDLASLCMETIDVHTTEAITAEGFLELDHKTLCLVLERETLHIREHKLFAAVDKWAEHECLRQQKPVDGLHKRQVLENALDLIRFPVMSIEEFAQGPAQSGLLTDKEVKELFLYFTLNPKPDIGFLNIPRNCLAGKEYSVVRFQQTENRWGFSGNADRIRFSVDRPVFVIGLGLYGSVHGPADYSVNMQILVSTNQRLLAQHDTTFSSDGTEATFRVMFKKPVEIQPTIHYTISTCIKGPDSYYGTRGLRKVNKVVGANNPAGVNFQFIYSPGNNNGTSVEDGQIPEIIFYTA